MYFYKSIDNRHYYRKGEDGWLHVNTSTGCINRLDSASIGVMDSLVRRDTDENNRSWRSAWSKFNNIEEEEFNEALKNTLEKLNINVLKFNFNGKK